MHHKVQEIAEPWPLVRSLPIDDGNFAPVAEDFPRAEIPVLDGDRQVGAGNPFGMGTRPSEQQRLVPLEPECGLVAGEWRSHDSLLQRLAVEPCALSRLVESREPRGSLAEALHRSSATFQCLTVERFPRSAAFHPDTVAMPLVEAERLGNRLL